MYQTTVISTFAARPTLTWDTWEACAKYVEAMVTNGVTVTVEVAA